MVSMMNVRKDLLKFATLDRASSISSASWVRGLMIIGLNWLCRNTNLVIIKHLSKLFKHYFLSFLTLFSVFCFGCSAGVTRPHWRAIGIISN